jgi:hypothetical protein
MGPYHAHPYIFYSILFYSIPIFIELNVQSKNYGLILHFPIITWQNHHSPNIIFLHLPKLLTVPASHIYRQVNFLCPHGCENVVLVCGGTMGHTTTSLAQLETGQQK